MGTSNPLGLRQQALLNRLYLCESAGVQDLNLTELSRLRRRAVASEAAWLRHETSAAAACSLPSNADDFQPWYRRRCREQIADAAPFFDALARRASLEQMALYVQCEEQVDGKFDDVIARAQIGLESGPKMALARNYWDEMGLGNESQMHTTLFCQSAEYFRGVLSGSPLKYLLRPTGAALANGNLLLMLSLRREHSAKLLGALTLLEHTAPRRFSLTVEGMRRLRVPESIIYYHAMHIKVDARHGDDLLKGVVLPLLRQKPALTKEVATGVLWRLQVARRYYRMLEGLMAAARSP